MRRTLILTCALALTGQQAAAQSMLMGERPDWTEAAPRVRVFIDGSRAVNPGTPVQVRFEVSDDAFVTVVRVDGDGRMSILFPYSRTQRAVARAGTIHNVRSPRLGDFAFVVNDRFGGYVFALASYAPLDFSGFENRDFERYSGWSAFTQVNRSAASRPDVFIDRFAASVLWDRDTPYDYDIDYYAPIGHSTMTSAYAMCGSLYDYRHYGMTSSIADYDLVGYPYRNVCRSWMANVHCLAYLPFYSSGCGTLGTMVAGNPNIPKTPAQPTGPVVVPNEGVVKGGMAAPTPPPIIPVGGAPEPPPVERPAGSGPRFAEENDWEKIRSIPARSTRRMKEEDVRRERGSLENELPARTAPERPEMKRERPRTADAGTRSQPPMREPSRVRETTTRRDDDGFKAPPARTTSEPRPTTSDRVNRPIESRPPAEAKPTGSTSAPSKPPEATKPPETERKKPPQ